MARLRAAGAIVIGKGNTNEFAYGIDGRNPHRGDARNPHDPARITGGSSSGPAVATAAGMALAGLGTDTSGSIRVPSALCGLVGIRPALGAVPTAGVVPLAPTYDVVGPMARTVEDAALLLEILAPGLLDGDLDADPASVRIGLVEELIEAAAAPIATRLRALAAALEDGRRADRPGRAADASASPPTSTTPSSAPRAPPRTPSWFEAQRENYATRRGRPARRRSRYRRRRVPRGAGGPP